MFRAKLRGLLVDDHAVHLVLKQRLNGVVSLVETLDRRALLLIFGSARVSRRSQLYADSLSGQILNSGHCRRLSAAACRQGKGHAGSKSHCK